MAHIKIDKLEEFLAARRKELDLLGDSNSQRQYPLPHYEYVEIGKYKPYHASIRKAAEKRGYEVDVHCHGTVLYVYAPGYGPKAMASKAASKAAVGPPL